MFASLLHIRPWEWEHLAMAEVDALINWCDEYREAQNGE